MRQKLAFALGLVLGAALVRLLRGRRARPVEVPVDPRVEQLRRKLAAQRESPPAPPATPEGRLPAAARPPEDADVEGTRRRIYEEGRAAVEEMRRAAEPPPPP